MPCVMQAVEVPWNLQLIAPRSSTKRQPDLPALPGRQALAELLTVNHRASLGRLSLVAGAGAKILEGLSLTQVEG